MRLFAWIIVAATVVKAQAQPVFFFQRGLSLSCTLDLRNLGKDFAKDNIVPRAIVLSWERTTTHAGIRIFYA